ncbi:nuclear transport factor 2 family protein [Sphingomonas solaris]|uniref:Nuclear transport factor 2 family protein n=1 Tax=Alterirhizorhabdus solaris TaxID=2529389 RepID=A0A558RCI1_9SPHN|nr:nuclear transport factor 2 family protein [Sphingomonas solaris]TVV77149.1 nuclear transport factor 2 family protein [Sphingomonas solaris]
MRRNHRLLAAAAIGAALIGAAPVPNFNDPADVAAIFALEARIAGELDADRLIADYAEDAVVLDTFTPGVFRGRAQIRDGFATQLAKIRSLAHTAPETIVATNGTFGCAAMQIAFRTEMKDGTRFTMNLRQLDALKKVNGRWQIVQQHISLPLDPKTQRALLDAPIQPRTLSWSARPVEAPSTTPAQAKAEIRLWMDIGGASQGLDMLMGYYGPGDDLLVYDSLHPRALIGRKEVRGHYAAVMNSYKDIKLSMPMFVADSDGAMGVQINTQNITLTLNDGTASNVALRQSDCMRRIGGKWYSFLEMVSYPVDQAAMKGMMTGPGAAE